MNDDLSFEKRLLQRKLYESRRVLKANPEDQGLKTDIETFERNLARIKNQEEETKEEVKRKKEELRLKREEMLVDLNHGVRTMIDDEERGIKYYGELITKAEKLGFTDSSKSPIIFELRTILDEEKRHLFALKEMMNWTRTTSTMSIKSTTPERGLFHHYT